MFLGALLLGLQWLSAGTPAELAGAAAGAPRYSLDEILDAVQAVESGGCANGGRDATGDGGRAIGPYQIHRAYFRDSRVAGHYEDCRDPEFSRRVVIAYWKRWCPDALARCDAEVLARVHNGGPRGDRKRATLKYWSRVQAWLAAPAS
jgi:hypothetical protein